MSPADESSLSDELQAAKPSMSAGIVAMERTERRVEVVVIVGSPVGIDSRVV